MNLRTLSSNLFHGLERIFDIFGRRFNLTIHEFHKSFIKQLTALQKANAIANASLFAGLSVIKAIMNAFELMIIVSISILLILVVLVIFLFFLLAPVIPLILTTITVIGTTAYAGKVGTMKDSFCFTGETMISLQNGLQKRIDVVDLNDILVDGSSVTSVLKFKTYPNTQMYNIDGVIVSGSHIIYQNGVACFVKDISGAEIYNDHLPDIIYCLNTTSHHIPVIGNTQSLVFADWEELDSDSMSEWSNFVYKTLNNKERETNNLNNDTLNSETGVSSFTLVNILLSDGKIIKKSFSELLIGDKISDVNGWTTIIGLANISNCENNVFGVFNDNLISGSTWILDSDNIWKHAIETNNWKNVLPVDNMNSIFTESGTFKIANTVIRDYSDIGLENISKTYNLSLSRLNKIDK
jgi:hypothetical protein